VDFKLKLVKRDKEGHIILIKGIIYQDKITIINLYAPNVGAPKLITHTLMELKSWIDSNAVVVGDFSLSPICHLDNESTKKF
jgi:hypothetical protein